MSRKSIVDLSREMGISRQAIHQRIKQEPLSLTLKDNIFYAGKKMFVDDEGEKIIRQAYFNKSSENLDNIDEIVDKVDEKTKEMSILSTKTVNIDNEIIKLLQQNISILQQQLEIKDKQIEELAATVKIQAESINHDRKNDLAETLIDGNQRFIESESKSGNIFQRIFKRQHKRQ